MNQFNQLRLAFAQHRGTFAMALLCLLAVFRLYLTADRDIAAWNATHDEFWYVHKAYIGIWAGRYDELSFAHLPTYALWLELLNTYGMPARVGIELAWIGAVLFLAHSLARFTGSWLGSTIAAAFLLLHPYSVYIFDRSLAETLLGVTVVATIGAAMNVWRLRDESRWSRRAIASLLLALLFAVSCNLRKEGITLLAPAAVFAVVSLVARRLWWTRGPGASAPLGISMFVLPIAAALAMSWSFAALNYAKWGTFVAYDLDNPGYKAAMANLARIDNGPTLKRVSITRAMLERAYEVSPTFRELRPQLSGPVAREWTDLTTDIGARG